jgi:hypothetical protein
LDRGSVAQGATATPAGTRTARTPLGLTWEDVFVCRAGAVHSAPTMLAVHPASMRAARGRGRPCARGAACVHRAGCTSDCTQEALGGLAVRRRCHGGLFLIGALAHPGRRCKVLRAADWRVRRSPVTGPDASPAAGPRQPTQCLHRAYTAPTQCPHSAYIAAASSPSTVDRRPSPAAPERLSTARREAPDASQAPPGVHLCPLSAALISRRRGAIASPSLVQAPERKWPAPSGPPRPIIRSRPYPSPASPAVPYRAQPPRLPPRLHPASPTASRQLHQLVHAAFRRADVMLAVSSVLCGASLHNRALTKPSPHRLSCRSFHGPLLVFLDHTPMRSVVAPDSQACRTPQLAFASNLLCRGKAIGGIGYIREITYLLILRFYRANQSPSQPTRGRVSDCPCCYYPPRNGHGQIHGLRPTSADRVSKAAPMPHVIPIDLCIHASMHLAQVLPRPHIRNHDMMFLAMPPLDCQSLIANANCLSLN